MCLLFNIIIFLYYFFLKKKVIIFFLRVVIQFLFLKKSSVCISLTVFFVFLLFLFNKEEIIIYGRVNSRDGSDSYCCEIFLLIIILFSRHWWGEGEEEREREGERDGRFSASPTQHEVSK